MLTNSIKDELKETLALCYGKLGLFSKTFMPEKFNTPFSVLHNRIVEALDSEYQKIAIAAPRGLGKTSLASALAMAGIVYRDYEFITYCSQSEPHAIMQTENIKRELLTNQTIRKIFGNIKIDSDDPDMDESFGKHAWVAFGNTLVMPRGMGQQVRGLLFKQYRPQLIIVDDLEDRKELENPENRRKTKEWFHADLLRSVDRYSNKWKILYIDTLKHSEALLQELLNDKTWHSLRLDLCDDDYNSNAPYLISSEELKAEAEAARENGTLDIFYMEYRNLPISKENMSFRQEYFKYYQEAEVAKNELENVVIVDPAKTVQIQNADSAIVGIGVNYLSGALYFRDCVSGKMFPDQIYKEAFEMAKRLGAHIIGVEVTGLEEFIKQPMTNYMMTLPPSFNCELVWLKARGGEPGGEKGKIKRIGSLVPYYRQGTIYHNKSCCGKLEAQLLSFPRSGLVDVADATAYIVELLELGGRYFSVPEDLLPKDDEGNPEDEFAELEYDEPLADTWRLI